VDIIALSFVRSPADIDHVHKIMDETGARLPVIAKPEAVDNLEAIVLDFDGIMVARGDLGVELPLEHVPLVQKRAIQIAGETPSRSSWPPRCSTRSRTRARPAPRRRMSRTRCSTGRTR
jgi:pyruvate kinase